MLYIITATNKKGMCWAHSMYVEQKLFQEIGELCETILIHKSRVYSGIFLVIGRGLVQSERIVWIVDGCIYNVFDK